MGWCRTLWWAGAAALLSCALALREKQLPFCNDNPAVADNDLVIVSTLDGTLTAFSAEGGTKAWDLQTEPLLNSNLHHVELTSGGKWVRLVPSLSGALYRLSGDTLEQLPLTAEQLLSSSFKYSEDLVIAGSRETMWAGVEAQSGRVVYRCGSAGCSSEAQTAQDLLVLKHSANTVRALDPRTGQERWNFSVAEHQLSLSESSGCEGAEAAGEAELAVTLVLPDGVVGVRRADRPDTLLWQHQLAAPVADVWRLRRGVLRRVDVLWAGTELPSVTPPSLYIGVHDQQLYVQEGATYSERLQSTTAVAPLPWRPKPARPLLGGPNTALQPLSEKEAGALALMSLYGKTLETISNHGYFLYAEEGACDKNVSEEDLIEGESIPADPHGSAHQETHHHVHVHVYSLWFWWKEVLLIAVSSALLLNLMIWPRFFAPKFRPPSPLPINQEYIVVERHYDPAPAPAPALAPLAPAPYNSRYACDFTPLRCLGRGGFGVVFECRNNIDHCSYAVKRITLPRRERKRERVLREVRALAKLEHEHIVRYFNAWLEEPPLGWQERLDQLWSRDLDGITVSITEDPTSHKEPVDTHTTKSIAYKNDTVKLDLPSLQKPWGQSLDFHPESSDHFSKRHRSLSCNDSFSIVFSEQSKDNVPNDKSVSQHAGGGDDDSFIVFANSSEDFNHNSKGFSREGAGSHLKGFSAEAKINKHLEKVKDCESGVSKPSNKKGHRRHWSLDLCVKSTEDREAASGAGARDSKMYLYIQMQLCLRDSLHDWLRQNRSYDARRDKVTSLFSQIVSAVEYVHLAGLIHRDLKPSNIFFAPDGRVKVGDFGLVTAMSEHSQDEESDVVEFNAHARHTYKVGTHLYMSPEQLRGDPYNFKVDIYSLGLILFELLQPFETECERVSCLLRLREGHFPKTFCERLQGEACAVPVQMELLQWMLAPEPSARPTAGGVRADTRWRRHT